MGYDVPTGVAYAVLYGVMASFTILAMGSANMLSFLPSAVTKCCMLKTTETGTADYFLSARNSAGAFAVGMSFFAGGMGAWVVYGTTEMGANPQLSWLGVLGYSGASALPGVIVCFLGPMMRARSEDAFSSTDFGRERYGRVMQLTIAGVSIFYMFIFIVAELTSISNVFKLVTGNYSTAYGVGITLSIGLITVFYTGLAGLPASIITDKFQGILMFLLVCVLTIAITAYPANHVTREEFQLASNLTVDGLMAAVTLLIAIACAEMFNQSTWQRVWAAESVPALRKGYLFGCVLVFLLMMFFGIMGMLAYANDPEAYDTYEKYAYLAFFDLLEPLSEGWHVLVLILVTALAASSIDTLQNGLTCIFSADLVKLGWDAKWITRIMVIAMNAPAIYLASKGYDVISLFLVADLVCATSVFPTFLGLQTMDKGRFFKAPTELGAFLGCISGVVTVVVNGMINDAQGGLFDYFWLNNGAICSLCGSKTMVSFIVTPLISAIMTYVFTYLDIALRGDRARKPIFTIAFDVEDDDPSKVDLEVKAVIPNSSDEESDEEAIVVTDVEKVSDDDEEGAPLDATVVD